jgi:hypothetical protein
MSGKVKLLALQGNVIMEGISISLKSLSIARMRKWNGYDNIIPTGKCSPATNRAAYSG